MRNNYDFLPDGYSDTLIYTETLNEVLADKLVSLPATRKYVRNRDIWDLVWLRQQGATLNPEFVRQKIEDYRISGFEQMLTDRIESLPTIISSGSFRDEMKRFLPTDVFDRTLAKEKFVDYLINSLTELLGDLKKALYGTQSPNEFSM